jgi:hypothetical protein
MTAFFRLRKRSLSTLLVGEAAVRIKKLCKQLEEKMNQSSTDLTSQGLL